MTRRRMPSRLMRGGIERARMERLEVERKVSVTQAQRAARNTKPIVVPAPPRRTASDFATPVFSIRKVK